MIFEDSPLNRGIKWENDEGVRCQAETRTGQCCKRKAKTIFKDEVNERFLLFFKKKTVDFFYYCNQHVTHAMRGERIV